MEAAFFFESNGKHIFSVLHSPDEDELVVSHESKRNNRVVGVVLCAPFAEEKLWSQRVFVSFARLLAKHGYYVLRFDYMGHGDSQGNFEDATVDTRLVDISRAVEVLRQKTGLKDVGLIGLRFGATLAAIAARRDDCFLVLWEPLINGSKYLQQCMRSNLATQLLIYRKILTTRQQLIENLMSGEMVNIDGYLISRSFYLQASGINLLEDELNTEMPTLIFKINKTSTAKTTPEYEGLAQRYCRNNEKSVFNIVREQPFWTELKTYFQYSETIFSKTLSWMDGVVEMVKQEDV